MRYLMLGHPGHNRVYYEAAKRFMASELVLVGRRFAAPLSEIYQEEIAGVSYLGFDAQRPLEKAELLSLSRLSFAFALFERRGSETAPLLAPVELPSYAYVNPGLGGILRYTGKTNETFTRMLINVAAASSDFAGQPNLRLLDPVAGKGTTLYEALACGYHAFGIEVGDKIVLEAYHFIKRYLEGEKFKHETHMERVSGPNKSFTAHRYHVELARDKESFKAGNTRTFDIVSGNSMYANHFYKKESMHILVGDLPYGVQHSNVTNEKQSSLTRNPSELLRACLPAWREVLKPGGVMALSWNAFVLPREALTAVLAENGFDVLNQFPYNGFEHRVDQAILRDVMVARRR